MKRGEAGSKTCSGQMAGRWKKQVECQLAQAKSLAQAASGWQLAFDDLG